MLSMLIGYDEEGNVVATLDSLVVRDSNGLPTLMNFTAHEEAGGEMTDMWIAHGVRGSKTWPEWIGGQAGDFRVELVGPAGGKRIGALVHKQSGHRRERAVIEQAIRDRIEQANGEPADIRDLVGGPGRPLVLNVEGR